jgi:uncharacterized protein YndB with AHSA1/START domain
MTHPFEVTGEVSLDATPEEVWDAIATGPGIDAWFMGHNDVEPGQGGTMNMTMGGYTQGSTITAWEPNKRIAFRGEEAPDGAVHAFEYLVEGREGGSTVLRFVHSGFMGDDWEAEYEALSKGWGMYLDKLAEYFTYFRGRTATPVFAMVPPSEGEGDVVKRLREGLGLQETPKAGDHVHLTPENLPAIDGTVDYVRGDFLGVRTDDAMYRFIRGYAGGAVLGHHLFAEGVDREATEQAWQDWLTKLFA